MIRIPIALLVLLMVSAPTLRDANGGTIRGTVAEYQGNPIGHARVTAQPVDGKPSSSAIRFVESDSSGKFEIRNLPLAVYKIFAMKERDGYPNTLLAFYSGNQFPTVSLSATNPTAEIALNLGRPAGTVVVSLADSRTNVSVDGSVILRRTDHPKLWVSTAARTGTPILVPADVGVTVEAAAPGYHQWRMLTPAGNPEILRLNSGERHEVHIQLDAVKAGSIEGDVKRKHHSLGPGGKFP